MRKKYVSEVRRYMDAEEMEEFRTYKADVAREEYLERKYNL